MRCLLLGRSIVSGKDTASVEATCNLSSIRLFLQTSERVHLQTETMKSTFLLLISVIHIGFQTFVAVLILLLSFSVYSEHV